MHVKTVIKESVKLHQTNGFQVFEIEFSVEPTIMELRTCLRTKPKDSTGYCAETVVIDRVRAAADILTLPFHWDDVSADIGDVTTCKKSIIELFFEACKRQSQLHQ